MASRLSSARSPLCVPSETNKNLILRSAPKARVSKDGPRARAFLSFETARYARLLRMR